MLAIEQHGLSMQGDVGLLGVPYRYMGAGALGFRFLATTQGVECVGQMLTHQGFKTSGAAALDVGEDRAELRLSLHVTLSDLVGSGQEVAGEDLETRGK